MTACVAAAVAGGVVLAGAQPAQASPTVSLGAVGDVSGLSQKSGAPLAVHTYGYFTRNVPNVDARMITVRAPGYSWKQVAAAAPGQPLYTDIVHWAQTIRSRGTQVMLAYHHEPESKKSTSFGTSADYVAAYRHVVDIFRQQGVTNVEWVWQMTSYAFDVSSSDRRAALKWYPGDSYVDSVGADAYAWGTCYGHQEKYKDLQLVGAGALAFARAHGKKASFPEFGAAPNPQRAQWVSNVHQYLAANRDVYDAAFYFNLDGSDPSCSWKLTTQPETQAFGSMARDTAVFAG